MRRFLKPQKIFVISLFGFTLTLLFSAFLYSLQSTVGIPTAETPGVVPSPEVLAAQTTATVDADLNGVSDGSYGNDFVWVSETLAYALLIDEDDPGAIYIATWNGTAWSKTEVVTESDYTNTSTLLLDSNNKLHFFYRVISEFDIYYVTNASGSWVTVDTGIDIDEQVIEMDNTIFGGGITSGNEPIVALVHEDPMSLYLVHKIGGSWASELVDQVDGINYDRLGDVAFTVGPSDTYHLVYNMHMAGVGEGSFYAEKSGGSWSTEAIEEGAAGSGSRRLDPAIEVGSDGKVHLMEWYGTGNKSSYYVRTAAETWTAEYSLDNSDLQFCYFTLDHLNNPHAICGQNSLGEPTGTGAEYYYKIDGSWEIISLSIGDAVAYFSMDTTDDQKVRSLFVSGDEGNIYKYWEFNGFQIASLDTNLDAEFSGANIEDGTDDGVVNTEATIRIEKSNVPYADVNGVDMSEDRTWASTKLSNTSVTSQTSLTVTKTLFHVTGGIDSLAGSPDDFDLYIKKLTTQNLVRICEGADSLSEIVSGCYTGGGNGVTAEYTISDEEDFTLIGGSEPDPRPVVTSTSIGGSNYWKVSGLTGTGGQGEHEVRCGDDTAEGSEVCDGTDLEEETCVTQGFGGGTLSCNASCSAFVTTSCTEEEEESVCGDNVIEGIEICDGTALGGETCVTQGYDGGSLSCNETCDDYDISACTTVTPAVCGNNTREGSEVCDGTDLAGSTCFTYGYDGGTLACNVACSSFDTSSCFYAAVIGETICSDSLDNDADGYIDCDDYDCRTFPVCQVDGEEICYNSVDDDGDSYIDCKDYDCRNFESCQVGEICHDGSDNDGDGDTDCDDRDCRNYEVCSEEICNDEVDNDGDGYEDCEDLDCREADVCEAGDDEEDCYDDIDNDGDGNTDCDDSECSAYEVCEDSGEEDVPPAEEEVIPPAGEGRIELEELPETGIASRLREFESYYSDVENETATTSAAIAVAQLSLVTPGLGLGQLLTSFRTALESEELVKLAGRPVGGAIGLGIGKLYHRIFGIFTSFFKKKRRPWGFVYDATNRSPVAFATIDVYDQQKQLISSVVSDLEGRFILTLTSGMYRLAIHHSDFEFIPIEGSLAQRKYDGGYFDMQQIEAVGFDIPMQPKESLTSIRRSWLKGINLLKRVFNKLRWVITVVGLVLSIVAVVFNPGVLTIGVLVLYVVSFIWNMVASKDPKKWGTIYDEKTDGPVSHAKVEIFDEKNEVIDSQLTDENGHYGFFDDYAGYRMQISVVGYELKTIELEKGPGKGLFRKTKSHISLAHAEGVQPGTPFGA